jgi:hypothetical protein
LKLKQSYFLVLCCLIFFTACASPNPDLWPAKGEKIKVAVFNNGFHSSLVIPGETVPYVEYYFAEIDWVLNKKEGGCCNISRAMLWPSDAYLSEEDLKKFPSPSTINKRYFFNVSPEGLAAIKKYLSEMKTTSKPFNTHKKIPLRYYNSNQNYHVFYTCNTFTAELLEVAGLPINPSFTISAEDLLEDLEYIEQWKRENKIGADLNGADGEN